MSAFQQTREPVSGSLNVFAPADKPAGATWLSRYAKLVVGAILVLLFIGGLVTSLGAGMAVPDWPLSFNSLNPHGWWGQFPVRLEHGHRMTAIFVGLLVGGLCAWIWEYWQALVAAIVVSAVVPALAGMAHAPRPLMAHLAIWPAAGTFIALILFRSRGRVFGNPPEVRWISLALYVCVCIQATLGGLRVTRETAQAFDTAMVLRIAHGSFAQLFVLSLAVATAALLSPVLNSLQRIQGTGGLAKFAWAVYSAVALQLIFGATMRHLGAGMAIPSFPEAATGGRWLPAVHNSYVDVNFTHTRVLALAVTALIVVLVVLLNRKASAQQLLIRPAWVMLALLAIQVTLGVLVIKIQAPPTQGMVLDFLGRFSGSGEVMEAMRVTVGAVKTVHVLNGALILSTSLLLAIRLTCVSAPAAGVIPSPRDRTVLQAV